MTSFIKANDSSANEALAHCESYYTATVNQKIRFPRLQGEQRADVCVIGGGFTGISTALTLAECGYSVALLEQHRIGWGASGRNGGQLIAGYTGRARLERLHGGAVGKILNDMAYRGHEIIEERIKKYSIDCDLKYGYIDVAFKKRQLRELKESFEKLANSDLAEKYRMVEGDEINEVMGTEAYVGGLINNRNGHLHPLNLCLGEAQAASEIGVSIFENSAVISIEHGEKPRVKTQTGQVMADFVILAGNAYNELEQKKLNKLLFPATTFIIATEPLDEDEVSRINPLDLAVCDMNEITDYYRLSADKRMLFGGLCNYTGREPLSIKATLLPRMLKLYPELVGKSIEYEWGGKIGMVVSRVPLIGRASKNVFYSLGYCGHGVNVTHMASEIMAEAVAGTFERMDLFERMRHVPIPLGNKLGNYLVALGMMYYRLLDLR